jgi:hypothetical protein
VTKRSYKSSFIWTSIRTGELLLAVLVVFVVTSRIEQGKQDRFDSIPPTEWFEVSELFVPDHEVGDDPLVVYDREIKTPFQGFKAVEVERRDGSLDRERFLASCVGSGLDFYNPDDSLDPASVTWSWFIGRPCVVPPGTYRLVATWDMRSPEFDPVKRYKVLSNVFTVHPLK